VGLSLVRGLRLEAVVGTERRAAKGWNRAPLEVSGVKVDEDGKGVCLGVEDMRPAMQMRIGHAATKTVIHSTVHRMAKR
jgi:hypothetical protein